MGGKGRVAGCVVAAAGEHGDGADRWIVSDLWVVAGRAGEPGKWIGNAFIGLAAHGLDHTGARYFAQLAGHARGAFAGNVDPPQACSEDRNASRRISETDA